MSRETGLIETGMMVGMNRLVVAALLALTALGSRSAFAQVYGTNDNPYDVNPFASNMVVPQDLTPAPAAPTPTPASTPVAAPQQQDSGLPQQSAATTAGEDIKKENKP